MLDRFIRHIRTKNLLDLNKVYLLGISGGIDSVCLGHLLKAAGIEFALAHVNFQLRGEESEGDEAFVRKLAEEWRVPFFVHKAELNQLKQEGNSTQMAARDLRYAWFESLKAEKKFEGILVAHHFEDQIETVLLNLLRGTGIEGIYGMADRRGDIIRPLLPFRRTEIMDFMSERGHTWREDSTNFTTLYKRNFLRNEVIPLLKVGFPDAPETLEGSFQRLKDTGKAFFYLYDHWKNEHVYQDGDYSLLNIEELAKIPGRNSLLYYWLRDYGFGFADVKDIQASIESREPGKTFIAGEYILNLDRDTLILGKNDFDMPSVQISPEDISFTLKNQQYDILQWKGEVELDRNPSNAMLDKDKLQFPLFLRKWAPGDKIVPLGMKNEKKISDLLIDLKVPMIRKKTVMVLCSGAEVVWLVGFRISERFKCDANTRNILHFKKR